MLGLDLAGSLERDERGLLYRSFKERQCAVCVIHARRIRGGGTTRREERSPCFWINRPPSPETQETGQALKTNEGHSASVNYELLGGGRPYHTQPGLLPSEGVRFAKRGRRNPPI